MVDLDLRRIGAVQKPHAGGHMLGRKAFYRGSELPLDRLELLIGHEPHAHLRGRFGGYDGFRPLAHEAAEDPMDLEGGERPKALEHRVLLQANESFPCTRSFRKSSS